MLHPKLICAIGIAALCIAGFTLASEDKDWSHLWEIDRDGLRQWAKFEADCEPCNGSGKAPCQQCTDAPIDDCAKCKGKAMAKCRDCGGKGEQYHPLEEMVCPYCSGSALWACPCCRGKGSYEVVGGSKDGVRCGPCKATGALKCEACKGKRKIPMLKAGGGAIAKASEESLERARTVVEDAIAAFKGLEPTARESDNTELYEQAIDGTSKNLPVFKKVTKMLESTVKALRDQENYVGYETWLAIEYRRISACSIKMLEAQLEALDLCRQRLDFNRQVREQ